MVAENPRSSRWIWIAVAIVVLAAIGVIVYMALYGGGGGGYGGGGDGSGGGDNPGGYAVVAFSVEHTRRLWSRISSKQQRGQPSKGTLAGPSEPATWR
jgi:flagellar basal body-associated protein FliL